LGKKGGIGAAYREKVVLSERDANKRRTDEGTGGGGGQLVSASDCSADRRPVDYQRWEKIRKAEKTCGKKRGEKRKIHQGKAGKRRTNSTTLKRPKKEIP